MGRGTWYYSLGVSSIVDAFVRVDGRSHLLSGETAGSDANRIIRDSKLREFSFYLVPLSYGSVDVANRISYGISTRSDTDLRKLMSCDVFFRKARGVERLQGLQGGVRVAREDDRGVTEGREDVREVFQQRRSGAKRNLSRCGRNQLGNEPILALPEGADDFVVYYDARSKDLEACLEKGRRGIMLDPTLDRSLLPVKDGD
ncbi:hypothetical protein Tco_0977270 [Tanacetum coccineum]|uniref:Uncharacterized protein n=1 Tax=Tanacetum coccineum TaxID=301880 RepID=A0ABQ5EK29_9ASTR